MSSPQTNEKKEEKSNDSRTKIEENDKNTSNSEGASCNPTLPDAADVEDPDIKLLKGDAIGDTLYSERFVLNTLLKLAEVKKDLQSEEEVERDLCSLWDMTIEKDVVLFLLEQDVLEIFAGIIRATEDKRLSEILVGILANMCNVYEARQQLEQQEETVQILLDLSSCLDSLTLEQLMRLFSVVFVKMEETSVGKWYNYLLKSDQFVKNIAFILASAANNTLVLQTMETLNAVLAKFAVMETNADVKVPTFEKVFVDTTLVGATIEGLQSLHKDIKSNLDNYDTIAESVIKGNQTFCNIHSILSQYGEISKESYAPFNEEMLSCIKEILKTVDDEPNAWHLYEPIVMDSLNDILRVLSNPFDLEIAQKLLKLHYKVSICMEERLKKSNKTNDFEESTDDENDVDFELLLSTILSIILFIILKTDDQTLEQCFTVCPRKYAIKLLDTFTQPIENDALKSCYSKLKDLLKV
ncbi:protein saal1 [Musca autumnalis]|uniref:protein saal1 n=1 Tax=Musca autumnalis TaxID=221902 RepID=UPI003CFAFD81